jgi:hypothetical protein
MNNFHIFFAIIFTDFLFLKKQENQHQQNV